MKKLILLTSLLLSCAGIQTDPTCKVEQFGRVLVRNNTDEYKTVSLWRVIFDDVDNRYKTVGKPASRMFEPMVSGSIRVSPGIILIHVSPHKGSYWMETYQIRVCGTVKIALKNKVVLKDFSIKSRRVFQNKCPPCLDCPDTWDPEETVIPK